MTLRPPKPPTNIVTLNPAQWEEFKVLLGDLAGAIDEQTEDIGKWLGILNETFIMGFTAVAGEIAKLQTSEPPPTNPGGVIMATFKVGASNPDIQIQLSGSGFVDDEGNPAGAGDIDLSVESSNPDAVSATLSGQGVTADTVNATVDVHFGAPASDIAVLTYRATNRDTGTIVAAGTDEFIVEAGEATLGTVTSSVPLTPEP